MIHVVGHRTQQKGNEVRTIMHLNHIDYWCNLCWWIWKGCDLLRNSKCVITSLMEPHTLSKATRERSMQVMSPPEAPAHVASCRTWPQGSATHQPTTYTQISKWQRVPHEWYQESVVDAASRTCIKWASSKSSNHLQRELCHVNEYHGSKMTTWVEAQARVKAPLLRPCCDKESDGEFGAQAKAFG